MTTAETTPVEPLEPEDIPIDLPVPPSEPTLMVRDPVCGAAVDPKGAHAHSVHRGEKYFFCSTACREVFEADPRRYTGIGGSR